MMLADDDGCTLVEPVAAEKRGCGRSIPGRLP